MKNKKMDSLKALSIGAMVLSVGATLVSSFVSEKKTDDLIAKKVNEAVTEALKKKGI